jgi:predicted dehydrogenase
VTLSITSSGRGRPTVAPDRVWASDRNNGATLLTISAGHALDTLRYSLGELTEVGAIVATLDPVTTVVGTDEQVQVTSPDNVLLNGRLAGGALFSAHFRSAPKGTGTRWSILGDRGALAITGTGLPHLADSGLILQGTDGDGPLEQLSVPDSYHLAPAEVPDGPAKNVAALYLALAEAIHRAEQPDPDFTPALSLHHLIDAIQTSSDDGSLVSV